MNATKTFKPETVTLRAGTLFATIEGEGLSEKKAIETDTEVVFASASDEYTMYTSLDGVMLFVAAGE